MGSRALRLVTASIIVCAAPSVYAQSHGEQIPIQEVIQRFAAAESQNKIARNNYTFTQDIDIQTIGEAGSITGRFKRVSDIVYDDLGNRFEKITYFPPSTLTLNITREDEQDLGGIQPFALTTEDLPKYQIDYTGKERLDELDTYIFDVKPKKFQKNERYFQGRIWVDDHDLQIVKVAGIAVPEIGGQKFPHFESYRENIDGRFWFPTYTYADDVLEFKNNPVRLRVIIRYKNYKKFVTGIRVVEGGEPATEEEVKAAEKDKAGEPQQQKKPEPKRPPRPPQRLE